jgi:hypothetical protein
MDEADVYRSRRAAKIAKLHPYRESVVPELLPTDLEKLVRYCLWFQRLVGEHPGILVITWFMDEAWFHLSAYIHSQNTCVWAEGKPHEIHTELLYSKKRDELLVPYSSVKFLPRKCT